MSVLSIIPPIGIWKMEETTEEMWSLLQHKTWYLPEFSRLKAEQRQKEWLATRLLLKEMLGHEAIIHHHPNGAPYLSDAEQKQISISHTKDFVAIMLTDATQMAGIDIEYRSERVRKVRSRFLNAEEELFIDPAHETEHLLICWCAKETLYKIINRQEVDFCRHLHIQPFSYAEQGTLIAFDTCSESTQHVVLQYRVEKDFVITRVKNP